MPYEFRKVYLDLVTAEDEVCMLYLSFVRFFARWHAYASLEIYDARGRRTVIHSKTAPPLIDPSRGLDQLPVALNIPGGKLELEVRTIHDAWEPSAPSPVPELEWSIGALRCHTDIVLNTDQGTRKLSGEGYLDFVRMTKATRKLGLRSLRWGRVHLFERSLAFTALDLQDDRRWYVGVTRLHGRPARSYGSLSFDLKDGAGTVCYGSGGQMLRLCKPTLLHQGSPFDAERVPKLFDRTVCSTVSGPMHEQRWRAEASVEASHGKGTALHELVWFGSQARQAAKGKLAG